ncbi:hypothetical protein HYALB_00002252 [Hymenoscyphus albidus]|uniref:ubiquitinyl hydrolase 1 n=1 Tax=Hymenoscyphus albidus TaxID=595503 RepID=A0A9N9LLH3_9HELO|nr:hypothetical protein HYALB_00002252 [Hymenoscyphus albidus]
MATPRTSLLESIFHHVTLPPKLPDRQEGGLDTIQNLLTERLLNATIALRDETYERYGPGLDDVRRVILTSKIVNAGGKLDPATLVEAFRELQGNGLIIIHVSEQNAALLVRRVIDANGVAILFESFEASPLSEDALASKNALVWNFPGASVSIPIATFNDPSFQTSLADFLAQASKESIKRFAARTTKAGNFVAENRDTVAPVLITTAFMTILEANGTRYYPTILTKRVRDDVCWSEGEKPWRRSPLWLILRVAITRQLCTIFGGEVGRALYKFIICQFLSTLLSQSTTLESALLSHLKTKLCRRLAKLETDRQNASAKVQETYDYLFNKLESKFSGVVKKTSESIEREWASWKANTKRPVLDLPRHAHPRHQYLTLPNSGQYIQMVLSEAAQNSRKGYFSTNANHTPSTFEFSSAATRQAHVFASKYFKLAEIESIINSVIMEGSNEPDSETQCIQAATLIRTYMDQVADAYDGYSEKSVMLLLLLELWVHMDKHCIRTIELLKDYHPMFPSHILDVLQLLTLRDLKRIQNVRTYLEDRHKKAQTHMSIFTDPVKGCFAERYFDSASGEELQELYNKIMRAAETNREQKKDEWERKCQEFEALTKLISESSCIFHEDEYRRVHSKDCKKCYLERCAARFKINSHEDPLSSDLTNAKATVFELACPKAFIAYRESTWKIISTLAFQEPVFEQEPKIRISDYSELQPFKRSLGTRISLASYTKSFLITHYASSRFPVDLCDILLTNGLKLRLYDSSTHTWIGQITQRLTFAHHCTLVVPDHSPFSAFLSTVDFAEDSQGPSSYSVISSQTKCPSGLNIHEFLAIQALLSCTNLRWLQICRELGSANINLSTEVAAIVISHLALKAGPAHTSSHPLGAAHIVFQDLSFCKRLLYQLGERLEGINANYREIFCMECLVTLILRLASLGTTVFNEAFDLLLRVRSITLKWMKSLRAEIHAATSVETSRNLSRYALWAAILCRRTFAIYVESQYPDADAMSCFVFSSITFQDNLVSDPQGLPRILKNALIRDFKNAYRLKIILRSALQGDPTCLITAFSAILPNFIVEPQKSSFESDCAKQPSEAFYDSDGNPGTEYSAFTVKFLLAQHSDKWWIELKTKATSVSFSQTIHFHLLEGYFLVGGKPINKLPASYRNSVVLEELFGNESLLTYPSNLPGMEYMLAVNKRGHQIHLGSRQGTIFVKALVFNRVLEHIPRGVFRSSKSFDLPYNLIDDCIHWLDTATGRIEIRPNTNIWKYKPSNWIIEFHQRKAYRRQSQLLDPQSPLFQRVARLFRYFEYQSHLTVYQPEKGTLSVELRRLELSFSVNKRGLLESRQLRSEFDPDQDPGTWYGLMSAIVLRGVTAGWDNIPLKTRSIIVPIPPVVTEDTDKFSMTYKRHEVHVSLFVINNGTYGRYTINSTLGRLDCPAEPRLLYIMAQFHAFSSYIVPDPLTGRTGTEQAIHLLKSGICQPWGPLTIPQAFSLSCIASLTPARVYYPSGMKVMSRTKWLDGLTTTIQHDAFAEIVAALYAKSEQLATFAVEKNEFPPLDSDDGEPHLVSRSFYRRQSYQRLEIYGNIQPQGDIHYTPRDGWRQRTDSLASFETNASTVARSNVFECVTLLRTWPARMSTEKSLVKILQDWSDFGGYNEPFDRILLSDLLNMDFKVQWGPLVQLCRTMGKNDLYKLMFLLGTISFRVDVNMNIVRALIAFVVYGDLKNLAPPRWSTYSKFRQHQTPRIEYLLQLLRPCLVPYGEDERSTVEFQLSAKYRRRLVMAQSKYEEEQQQYATRLAEHIYNQWPCAEPSMEGFSATTGIDVARALEIIRPEWLRLFQNFELCGYIALVQNVLDRHETDEKVEFPKYEFPEQLVFPERIRGGEFPTLAQLFGKKGPGKFQAKYTNDAVGTKDSVPTRDTKRQGALTSIMPIEAQELLKVVKQFIHSKSIVRQTYGKDLMQSLEALATVSKVSKEKELMHPIILEKSLSIARQSTIQAFAQLRSAFDSHDPRVRWLQGGGIWPSTTTVTLLEHLRSSVPISVFGNGMREALVAYALSITNLQRLIRIEEAIMNGSRPKALEEQENIGHENWNPSERSDWLLLEIDANILIRPGQVDVALATIAPASGANSVLQMNCGQGKTSCIMPMSAAVLADGENLLRVIVPKPLLLQSAQTLQATLGRLLGRRITHVPFSRRTATNSKVIKTYFDIHKEILKDSGCIVALPENMMSFRLTGLQKLSDGNVPEATSMIKVQNWLNSKARDVMDEVDYILAIRTQLIFPSGTQKSVDGHPFRWEIIEAVLKQVDLHLYSLQKAFPQSIEVVRRAQGGFPVVFFLRNDVETELISKIVEDVFRGRCSILPDDCSKSDRLAIKKFISEPKPSTQVLKHIQQMLPNKPAVKQIVHLLRGILVHRILLMTLKKRWNVQYGLAPDRDPIAVPYQAKGTPSSQAEWGHPDVSILFTCLSFYYDGLNVSQLRQTLEHVLKSDDPSQVYDGLSQESSLPDSLRDWSCVNVDDEAQIHEIHPHFKYHVIVIDYFLNNFVFPRHAKQFQLKKQASGWDIPLLSSLTSIGVGTKAMPTSSRIPLTTGFSGTNDSKRMLPLTIKQQDLPRLAHTNAEVLTYLLKPRNRRYVLAADYNGKRLSEIGLLDRLNRYKIHTFIDAGAQILEMDNSTLAKTWLAMSDALACVFFNKDNKPFVLYRQGHQVPLLATPYADDLTDCLVYLDEAHTRGTDLKFPANAVAALTLGLGQTKDSTVQAAMRLRQLGTTQSVVIFSPPEVHQSILDLRKKRSGEHIDSYDAVCWLLEQTCCGIEQLQPLYFSQGLDFCRRAQCALDNPDFLVDRDQREQFLKGIRQFEQQTLEQLYGVKVKSKTATTLGTFSPDLAVFVKELNKQRKGFQDTGSAVNGTALQEVEQEREVAIEVQVENVREVQQAHYQPLGFPGLHRDILVFAKTGRLAADSTAFIPAFMALRQTNLGRKHGIASSANISKLFVSVEFTKTVKFPTVRTYDHFQRSVNWVLWSPINEIAMVIIPEEAERLLPLLREINPAPTHLLTYAAPVTRKMMIFNDMTYYSVPAMPEGWKAPMWLKIELGIFAGRLYFQYSDYEELCKYLGAHERAQEMDDDDDSLLLEQPDTCADDPEGEYIERAEPVKKENEPKTFTKKPLVFMQEWLAIRRKGQDFTHTPMGQLCQGKALKEDHPFFSMPEAPKKKDALPRGFQATRIADEEEDDDVDEFVGDDGYGAELGADEKDDFDDAQLSDVSDDPDTDSS